MQAKIWNNSTWIKETQPSKLKEIWGGVFIKERF